MQVLYRQQIAYAAKPRLYMYFYVYMHDACKQSTYMYKFGFAVSILDADIDLFLICHIIIAYVVNYTCFSLALLGIQVRKPCCSDVGLEHTTISYHPIIREV